MYIFPKLLLICEGDVDRVILAHLVQRLLSEHSIRREVEIIAAHGKAVIPRMVHAIEARMGPHPIAIVIDSDGNVPRTWAALRTKLPWEKYALVIAHPDVESWVFPDLQGGKHADIFNIGQLVQKTDLRLLEEIHPEFAQFRIAVTTAQSK